MSRRMFGAKQQQQQAYSHDSSSALTMDRIQQQQANLMDRNASQKRETSRSGTSPRKKTRSMSPHSRLLRRNRGGDSSVNSKDNEYYEDKRPTIVAVTSCRSDAYYRQKAPGSASKLPQKAPSALKLFHELATGVKDAFEAIGGSPPCPQIGDNGQILSDPNDVILWEFMRNVDFLLAIVDEVAVDTATRGALKDDTTFKCLRDVIKKCNKVLESMLVRRERKYTLFFRLPISSDTKQFSKMKAWNQKVEKAVGSVTDDNNKYSQSDTESETSDLSGYEAGSTSSQRKNLMHRGRSMLIKAAGSRGRRATPTPRLRNMYAMNGPHNLKQSGNNAAEDGFFANSRNVSMALQSENQGDVAGNIVENQNKKSQNPMNYPSQNNDFLGVDPAQPHNNMTSPLVPQAAASLSETLNNNVIQVSPKDELIDVIRGLKVEKNVNNKTKEGTLKSNLQEIKPNWQPKADIPSVVPKLPTEYIHRHRLMKQVVNCLLDQPSSSDRNRDNNANMSNQCYITSVTSRHSDKVGNGKTTLAVSAIQSVEVRERFSDGICWIKLGRRPLTEVDIRSHYEELYRQLLARGSDFNLDDDDDIDVSEEKEDQDDTSDSSKENDSNSVVNSFAQQTQLLPKSRRRFQAGELEGMKEDLYRIICKKKILICLDDVWSVEDAHWFLFHFKSKGNNIIHPNTNNENCTFRILITTRQPGLLGSGNAQEVYVRIFSEHEAVKLLLASAGKRPYGGGRNSAIGAESRRIVKGCGNSPLAVRLAGGLLARKKHWTNRSPSWISLMQTCEKSLEEATRMRSFSKAVGQIVDLSFKTVEDTYFRAALRRCFVTFAMVFQSNDLIKTGKGIPKDVILQLFDVIKGSDSNRKEESSTNSFITSELLLSTLNQMHLIDKARPPCLKKPSQKLSSSLTNNSQLNSFGNLEDAVNGSVEIKRAVLTDSGEKRESGLGSVTHDPCFVMHDSIFTLAVEMGARDTPSFAPENEKEAQIDNTSLFSHVRNAAKYFAQLTNLMQERATNISEFQFHELMVASLTHGWIPNSSSDSSITTILSNNNHRIDSSESIKAYSAEFLPTHLIKAKACSSAGELLADKKFIANRVTIMGPIEAVRRHVSDLIEMKKEASKNQSFSNGGDNSNSNNSSEDVEDLNKIASPRDSSMSDQASTPSSPSKALNKEFHISSVIRDSARRIVDEIYRTSDKSNSTFSTALTLTNAICLSAIGEGLVRCRQPRDAMLRLEEAVGVYRGLLGPYHMDVARGLNCVAKALVKLGEHRLALLKFGEAHSIYEKSSAALHFDAISNVQSMASILVDLGDYQRAESKYEEVLRLRRVVNGQMSYQVARTHNEYAAILAKQGKLDAAIMQYEEARSSLKGAASLYHSDEDTDDFDDFFNTTVIDLNIASIKAKKGDISGAIKCYEIVVNDLENSRKRKIDSGFAYEDAIFSKHIVAAMGRIGSLKLKLGDNSGALKMFEGILKELKDSHKSNNSNKLECARAHIKCATIYRQSRSSADRAVTHLKEAFTLYTQLYGPDHRDTQALQASLRQWQQDDTSVSTVETPPASTWE